MEKVVDIVRIVTLVLALIMVLIRYIYRKKKMKRYGIKTFKELEKLEKELEKVMDIYYKIYKKVEHDSNLRYLNDNEKTLYIAITTQKMIRNLGFFAFFTINGNLSNDIVNVFNELGLEELANICQEAIDALGFKIPETIETNDILLEENIDEKIINKLEECNSKFLDYSTEKFKKAMCDYFIKNKEYFE